MKDHEAVDCDRVRPLLPSLRDGSLGPAVLDSVRAHLQLCERCAAEVRGYERLGSVLHGLPLPALRLPSGEAVAARILSTRERPNPTTLSFPRPRWAMALAGAALGGALILRLAGIRPEPLPEVGPRTGGAPLQALVLVDDERFGRQVLLAPMEAPSEGGEGEP